MAGVSIINCDHLKLEFMKCKTYQEVIELHRKLEPKHGGGMNYTEVFCGATARFGHMGKRNPLPTKDRFINDDVLQGKQCPYCGDVPLLVDSKIIYGKSYGKIWLCPYCEAYCGVHPGTKTPLGRLASAELRQWKKEAHKFFDPLWQKKMQNGSSKTQARVSSYDWLCTEMGIARQLTHIGMFSVEQCKQVVNICKQYYSPSQS